MISDGSRIILAVRSVILNLPLSHGQKLVTDSKDTPTMTAHLLFELVSHFLVKSHC